MASIVFPLCIVLVGFLIPYYMVFLRRRTPKEEENNLLGVGGQEDCSFTRESFPFALDFPMEAEEQSFWGRWVEEQSLGLQYEEEPAPRPANTVTVSSKKKSLAKLFLSVFMVVVVLLSTLFLWTTYQDYRHQRDLASLYFETVEQELHFSVDRQHEKSTFGAYLQLNFSSSPIHYGQLFDGYIVTPTQQSLESITILNYNIQHLELFSDLYGKEGDALLFLPADLETGTSTARHSISSIQWLLDAVNGSSDPPSDYTLRDFTHTKNPLLLEGATRFLT